MNTSFPYLSFALAIALCILFEMMLFFFHIYFDFLISSGKTHNMERDRDKARAWALRPALRLWVVPSEGVGVLWCLGKIEKLSL